jgi:hypothetical protein
LQCKTTRRRYILEDVKGHIQNNLSAVVSLGGVISTEHSLCRHIWCAGSFWESLIEGHCRISLQTEWRSFIWWYLIQSVLCNRLLHKRHPVMPCSCEVQFRTNSLLLLCAGPLIESVLVSQCWMWMLCLRVRCRKSRWVSRWICREGACWVGVAANCVLVTYILARVRPSCFHLVKIWWCQVSFLSRWSPRYIWLISNERSKQCVLAVFSWQVDKGFCRKLPNIKSVFNQPAVLWTHFIKG